MKRNRLIALLLALCLIFSLTGCAGSKDMTRLKNPDRKTREEPDAAEAGGSCTPLLYRVSDEEGAVVWLFGSIHVGEDYFYPLPEYVLDAYESADSLAVECDMIAVTQDLSAQTSAMAQLVYSDGTTISEHIPEELYTRAVEIIDEGGMYMAAYDRYCPALWSTLIENIIMTQVGADAALGVDMHLLQRAYDDGKPIREIESIQLQYAMLGGFSEELQIMLLESSVSSYEHPFLYAAQLEAMMQLWAAGDEAAFARLLNQESLFLTGEQKLLYQEYNEQMITNRNVTMADFAEEAMASGEEVFICVGAAHVVGEDAMADLLEERGYTVQIVGQ